MKHIKRWAAVFTDAAVKIILFASLTYIFSRLFFTRLSGEYHILYDYLKYLLRILTFDLGTTEEGVPVSFFMRSGIINSARLFLPSLAAALIISYFLSYLYFRRKLLFAVKTIRYLGNIVTSVPIYWFALVLFMAAAAIPIIPIAGVSSPVFAQLTAVEQILDILIHMLLPALSLILPQILLLTRTAEIKIDELNNSEFIRTARAKGLSENYIFKKHLRKAVFAELLSHLHSILPLLITYLLIIERVYSYPGLGYHTIAAYRYYYSPLRNLAVAQSALVYLGIFAIIMQFIINSLLQLFLPNFEKGARKENSTTAKPLLFVLALTTVLGFGFHIFNKTNLLTTYSMTELRGGENGSVFQLVLISAAVLTVLGLITYVGKHKNSFAGTKVSLPVDFSFKPIQNKKYYKKELVKKFIRSIRKHKGPWIKICISSFFLIILLTIGFLLRGRQSTHFLSPPALHALMGTGPLGQDYGRQVLIASRYLLIPFFAAVSGAAIGTVLGLISGITRKKLLHVLIEFLEMFPAVIILVIAARLTSGNIGAIIITLMITASVRFYRIVSFQVLQLQRTNYVLYSSLLGSSLLTLLRRHILPNIMPLFLISLFYLIADIIVLEANLSFIGKLYSLKEGADLIPIEGWGRLLFEKKSLFLRNAWWLGLFPAVFLAVTVFSFRSIGTNISRILKS
jgi:peptide/nickel transport system permease protein